ncbi:YlmC/YmxH family sporulation protein [Clostridium mediterraneense]|uniref:YlmC/YmxH family sporulation protein n=1 Tax=Clostridium mediterraneense TaxID=1805472 RepID=UPI0008362AEB|nr:YlmC/YmxH family sporulation protein [Clostridium mediterraneense]
MSERLFSLKDLRNLEVIDINEGKKLGFILDVKVDCDNYKILSILLPVEKNSWFAKQEVIEIEWKDVVKVGVDCILVDVKEKILRDI